MKLCAFVLTVKYAKEYWVYETYRTEKSVQHVSLHEIDIQSQRLAENVLIAPPFFFLTAFSCFSIVQWIFSCLNGDFLPFVFDCLFEGL